MVDSSAGVHERAKRTAIVYSTDGCDTWRVRLSVASLSRLGIPQSQVFVLSPGHHMVRDTYVSERVTQVDVSHILRGVLAMPGRNWSGKWHYGVLCKLTTPLLDELSGFDQVLCLDGDTLVHSDAVWDLMAYPCRQYESVGGSFYVHGLGYNADPASTSLVVSVDKALRTILDDGQYAEMCDRIWQYNPLRYRVWFSDGICLLNLRRIREDIPWYLRRAAWLYNGMGKGLLYFATEAFCTAFLDAAALLPPELVVHNGTTTPGSPGFSPCAVHYNGRAYDPVDSGMVRDARKLGLDEAAFEHV